MFEVFDEVSKGNYVKSVVDTNKNAGNENVSDPLDIKGELVKQS